jgi:uncharacterized protein
MPVCLTTLAQSSSPALMRADKAMPDVTRRTDDMKKTGFQLNACINTMKAQDVTLRICCRVSLSRTKAASLLAELQGQGYVYLRP